MRKTFVIFDRDGTLIEHVHHLADPNFVELKSGLVHALTVLRDAGFRFGIVSNQSVIGRGLATFEQVREINNLIVDQLSQEGITFEFVYICPHVADDHCKCRKPSLLLGQQAILEYDINPSESFVIGDQESDMIFAKSLGFTAIQVSGSAKLSKYADFFAETIKEAAVFVLERGT